MFSPSPKAIVLTLDVLTTPTVNPGVVGSVELLIDLMTLLISSLLKLSDSRISFLNLAVPSVESLPAELNKELSRSRVKKARAASCSPVFLIKPARLFFETMFLFFAAVHRAACISWMFV